MQCDQCGSRRPRTGPCPNCGAPAPGTFSSMRQYRNQGRDNQGYDEPEEMPRRRGSGAGWGAGASGSGRRGSGANWGQQGEDDAPSRSGRRNRRRAGYEEVDLERALVPVQEQMAPMAAGATGLPALPGMPATDEEERAMGMRRPVYIPATSEKKVRPGTWRIVSGVLSVMLFCVASCGVAGLLGHDKISSWLIGPTKTLMTPQAIDYSNVPATPTSTPGAAAKYVKAAVTSKAIDQSYTPTRPTTHFNVNDTVYVALQVRGIAKKDKHTLSVRWFLDGTDVGVQGLADAQTSKTVTGESNVSFGLVYPVAGVGMAKIYWDKPASDAGDDPKDPNLAQTVVFGIYPATPTPSTKPTVKPTTKPGASPSPTKKASLGSAPVAWRDASASA